MTGMHPHFQIKKIDISFSILSCNRCYKIRSSMISPVCVRVYFKKQFPAGHCKLAVESYECSSPACHMTKHVWANIMQILRGYQKKCLLRRKSSFLSVRWKFHCINKIMLALFLWDLAIRSLSTLCKG